MPFWPCNEGLDEAAVLGERHIRTLLEGALMACKEATQAEVLLMTEDSALTRFAANTIHQNVSERNASLHVRVVMGKRIGVASTNSLEAAAVKETAESACTIARFSEANPDFLSLPSADPAQAVPLAFVDRTAAATPRQRATSVQAIIKRAEKAKLVAAGMYSTSCIEVAVANSLGIFAYHPSTVAEANTVVTGDTSSGYADRAAADAGDIEFDQIAEEACGRALRSANPRAIEPGDHEVVLEAYAVAEMLDYLSYVGFGAMQKQEGRSFMAERAGQQVAAPSVTIYDDGLDPRCLAMPFDFEGVPKQRVDLIKEGRAAGVVYDSYTAQREGRQSTGHALPAPNPSGPFPAHLHLAPGSASTADLIASIDRGLWITRFHYVNIIHPLQTTITGMTRDGAWWVERGEVQFPIKNLRFSQSVLGALTSVHGIGSTPKLQRGWFGGSLVPSLHLAHFTFTGQTDF